MNEITITIGIREWFVKNDIVFVHFIIGDKEYWDIYPLGCEIHECNN